MKRLSKLSMKNRPPNWMMHGVVVVAMFVDINDHYLYLLFSVLIA